MTITFTGNAQYNVYQIVCASSSGSAVEQALAIPLIERIFPPERRQSVTVDGTVDGVLDELRLRHVSPVEVEISVPEAKLLTRCLNDFHKRGMVNFNMGKWFYPLIENLEKGETK